MSTPQTVKAVVINLKHVLLRQYFILSCTIFVFVIQQHNLMVCEAFSLIGYDPKVSHLLAGIAMSIGVEGKGL